MPVNFVPSQPLSKLASSLKDKGSAVPKSMDNRLNSSFIEESTSFTSVEREEDDLEDEPSLSINEVALVITFGCLSFISTLLVISTIIRARKENNFYHRIVLLKSIFGDLLFSAALTLTVRISFS